MKKIIKLSAVLLASSLFASASFAEYYGATWTGKETITQAYISSGCNSTAGERLAVITVAGKSTQYAFPMTTTADDELFKIFYDSVLNGNKVQINYNHANGTQTFPVVRGYGPNSCGVTNPVIKVLGAAVNSQ